MKKAFPSVGGCVGYHVVSPITGIRLDHRIPAVERLSLVIKFEIFCRLKIILRWKVTESNRTTSRTRQLTCVGILARFVIRKCWTFVSRIIIFTTFLQVYSHITPIIIASTVIAPCTLVNKSERVHFLSKQKDENSLGTKKRDMIS